VRSRPAADTTALVLGVVTVVTALITAAVQGADHAAQVVSVNAVGVGVLSVLALGGAVVAFAVAVTRTRVRRRAVVGLVLALGAWPIAAGLLSLATLLVGGQSG